MEYDTKICPPVKELLSISTCCSKTEIASKDGQILQTSQHTINTIYVSKAPELL